MLYQMKRASPGPIGAPIIIQTTSMNQDYAAAYAVRQHVGYQRAYAELGVLGTLVGVHRRVILGVAGGEA